MKMKQDLFNLHLLWLAVICFTPFASIAQDSHRWFRKEFGVAQSSVYDNGHSFAKYKGTGLQLRLGVDGENSKRLAQFNNTLIWTPLKAKVDDDKNVTSAIQFNYKMSYTYLRKIFLSQNDKIKIAAGASLFADANGRVYRSLINNVFGWDLNLGVNIVGQASHDFKLKEHSFSVSYQVGIPMIVYNHSPNYLGNFPVARVFQHDDAADWFSLGRFVPGINDKYFYLHQQLSIDRKLSNGDKIRLTYSWDYSDNDYASHRYQNLITGISIGMLTSFSKRGSTNNK
jgi:hypothetical protein